MGFCGLRLPSRNKVCCYFSQKVHLPQSSWSSRPASDQDICCREWRFPSPPPPNQEPRVAACLFFYGLSPSQQSPASSSKILTISDANASFYNTARGHGHDSIFERDYLIEKMRLRRSTRALGSRSFCMFLWQHSSTALYKGVCA